MKKKQIFFFLTLVVFGCVVRQKVPFKDELLSPDMDLTPDNKTLIFPIHNNGKSAFFSLNIQTGNFEKISQTYNGSYGQIKLSDFKNQYIYIQNVKCSTGYRCCLMANSLQFDKPDTLLSTKYFISDFALALNDSMAYLNVVGDLGSSSPLVGAHPRSHILYSLNMHTKKIKRLIDTSYYMMSRSMTVTKDNDLTFTVFQGEKKYSGCVAYNVISKKYQSMTPANIMDLTSKKTVSYFSEINRCYRGLQTNEVLLSLGANVYTMDLSSHIAKPFYIQTQEDRKKGIQGLLSLNNQKAVVALMEIKPYKSAFCLLNENGVILRTYLPNLDSLYTLLE